MMPAVHLEEVSVRYRVPKERIGSIKEPELEKLGNPKLELPSPPTPLPLSTAGEGRTWRAKSG